MQHEGEKLYTIQKSPILMIACGHDKQLISQSSVLMLYAIAGDRKYVYVRVFCPQGNVLRSHVIRMRPISGHVKGYYSANKN